jgi:hypothetical protein
MQYYEPEEHIPDRPPLQQGFPNAIFAAGQEELMDTLRCGICSDVCRRLVRTSCGHVFCQECLGRWFVNLVENDNGTPAMSCPMCRRHIEEGSSSILKDRNLRATVDQLRIVCKCDYEGFMMIDHTDHSDPSTLVECLYLDESYITELRHRALDLSRDYGLNRYVRKQQKKNSSILDKCSICEKSLDGQCGRCRGDSPVCPHPESDVSSDCR